MKLVAVQPDNLAAVPSTGDGLGKQEADGNNSRGGKMISQLN